MQTENSIPERGFTVKELADKVGVRQETVYRWMKKELVKHVHYLGLIRIPKDEFHRVLKEGIVRKKQQK